MNKVVQKDSLSGSVSKIGFGDPFFSRAFKIFRKPVFRPSVRCISFKNSPILRFLYRRLKTRYVRNPSAVIERSGPGWLTTSILSGRTLTSIGSRTSYPYGGMALSGSGKRRISPQLHAGTGGQARRPLRHPGGGYSGRLHPVSAPGRRRLPPQIPGGKRLEPSAACRPCKGQPDKHPLLGEWTKDHQSEVLLPSGGKPWFRFSIYASHVRYGNFSTVKRIFHYTPLYPCAKVYKGV